MKELTGLSDKELKDSVTSAQESPSSTTSADLAKILHAMDFDAVPVQSFEAIAALHGSQILGNEAGLRDVMSNAVQMSFRDSYCANPRTATAQWNENTAKTVSNLDAALSSGAKQEKVFSEAPAVATQLSAQQQAMLQQLLQPASTQAVVQQPQQQQQQDEDEPNYRY